jgi:hypothetical protein
VKVWRRAVVALSGPVVAVAYCRAAQRDEKNGYVLTAAMEWRKAACLFVLVPTAADLCWQQWERIMGLPRRLAGPISEEAPGRLDRAELEIDQAPAPARAFRLLLAPHARPAL